MEEQSLKGKTKKAVALFAAACLTIIVCAAYLNASGKYSVYTYATAKKKLPIYSVERTDNKISISFDCAWGTEYTDEILRTLEMYNVKCTFFAVQFWVEKYPDYCKKITAAGHGLETHSKTHPHMSKLSQEEIKAELLSSKEAIEEITGKTVTLFRPPFGDYNDKVISGAEDAGLYPIQWDVDSLDWKNITAAEMYKRVVSRVKSGSIVLFHNNGLHTAEALPGIIDALKNEGFTFVTIGELIYKKEYRTDNTGRQSEI